MLTLKCHITRPVEAGFDLAIDIGAPTRPTDGANGYFCEYRMGHDGGVRIRGETPIDALTNALGGAKAFVEGKNGGNTVVWR